VDGWLKENIQNIMWGIEIAGLIAVAAIFTVYFVVKRKIARKKAAQINKSGK
jgi:hypothetical protein